MDSIISLNINGVFYLKDQFQNKNLLQSIEGCDDAFISFLLEWFSDGDVVVGHTSGSTGVPKEICLSKKAMIESAKRTNAFFQLKAGDSVLLCLSANYIAGKMMVVRALVGELKLYVQKPSSLPLIDEYRDFVSMVPMQVHALMESKQGVEVMSHVRYLLVGGSPLQPDVADWLKSLPVDTYISYGMTETVSHVALSSLKQQQNNEPVYNALPDVTFETDDRDCLVINANYLSSAPFVTNDVVELLSDVSFVWKGRWDHVINTGGVKVFPETVERKIADLILEPFYIIPETSDKFGQQVLLKIEGEKRSSDDLLKKLESRLSRYEMPKRIDFVSEFERTSSGKIKRK